MKVNKIDIKKPIEISKELEIINFRLLAEELYLKRELKTWIVDEIKSNKDNVNDAVRNEAYKHNKKQKSSKQTQFIVFQKAMTVLIAFGQCVGLNPVTAILSYDIIRIRFSVYSWRCLYAVLIAIGQITIAGLCFNVLFHNPLTIGTLAYSTFYLSTSCTVLIFIGIGKKWIMLLKEIYNCDLDKYIDPNIVTKCNGTCLAFLFLALMEHLLALLWKVTRTIDCCKHNYSIFAEVVKVTFHWLYDFNAPFNIPMGIILQVVSTIGVHRPGNDRNMGFFQEDPILNSVLIYSLCHNSIHIPIQQLAITNTISTILWNYIDIFIICTSLYFASLLEQINKRIISAADKNYLRPSTWSTLREDYTRATRLIRMFDEVLSSLVLVSFSTNLFFICLQLFNVLENGVHSRHVTAEKCAHFGTGPFYGYEYSVYLLYSLTFLFIRFLTVSLVAASVNVASEVPAFALYRVPSCCYCKEVERFLEQVHDDVVAFSGLGFFYITREIVLSVAGTITTYELVLLQFNNDELNDS